MEHSTLVKNLTKPGEEIKSTLTFQDCNLIHMMMGISGETGELLDAIKKHVIYRQPLDLENVIEELGDLEYYIEGLRQALNISRAETLKHNIDKLTKRYSSGAYSDSQAKSRNDKLENSIGASNTDDA